MSTQILSADTIRMTGQNNRGVQADFAEVKRHAYSACFDPHPRDVTANILLVCIQAESNGAKIAKKTVGKPIIRLFILTTSDNFPISNPPIGFKAVPLFCICAKEHS